MATQTRTTVVGVFEDRRRANEAVSALQAAGFTQSEIGVAMRHDGTGDYADLQTYGSHLESGTMAGVLSGLGLGALAGVGVLAGVIPVVGPAIAAGTLGVILSNAAAGAGIVGLAGALIGAGVPEHEATYYHNEFEAGRAIVTVEAGSRAAEAKGILRNAGAYDMETRPAATV